MGKRIIQQARGKGSLTYRVRKQAFKHTISYPRTSGEAEIISLIHSAGHSAPLMKIKLNNEISILPAFNSAFISQKIQINSSTSQIGNVLMLKDIPTGIPIHNIEKNPGDGGKMMRAAGTSTTITKKDEAKNQVTITGGKKREIILNENCRATIGVVAGGGKNLKPFITAGRKHYKMKARNKLWPRTSAVKVNAVDHPFGSGRGKRPKPKIAKRNAPAGRRVGHVRPRQTGHRK